MVRLSPGRQCAKTHDVVRSPTDYLDAMEVAQSLIRHGVRDRAAEQFDTDRIVDSIIRAFGNAKSAR